MVTAFGSIIGSFTGIICDSCQRAAAKHRSCKDLTSEWLDEQPSNWRNRDLEHDELEDTPENVQATLMKLTTRAITESDYRSKELDASRR